MERKRTKFREFKLPDAINRCKDKQGFTQIQNSILKNPNISGVAKTIHNILLSNKDGWTSHITELQKKMKEGRDMIKKGLTELNQNGLFSVIRYRDKNTKALKGSFLAITEIPFDYNYHRNARILEKKGYEIVIKSKEKSHDTAAQAYGFSKNTNKQLQTPLNHLDTGKPLRGKTDTNKTSLKKDTNEEKKVAETQPSKKPLPKYIMFQQDKYELRPKSKTYWYYNSDTGNYHRLPDECYPEGYEKPKV